MCSVAKLKSDHPHPGREPEISPGETRGSSSKKANAPRQGRRKRSNPNALSPLHRRSLLPPQTAKRRLGRPPTGPAEADKENALQTADENEFIAESSQRLSWPETRSEIADETYSPGSWTLVAAVLISALIQSVGWSQQLLTQNRTCSPNGDFKKWDGWMEFQSWAKQGTATVVKPEDLLVDRLKPAGCGSDRAGAHGNPRRQAQSQIKHGARRLCGEAKGDG